MSKLQRRKIKIKSNSTKLGKKSNCLSFLLLAIVVVTFVVSFQLHFISTSPSFSELASTQQEWIRFFRDTRPAKLLLPTALTNSSVSYAQQLYKEFQPTVTSLAASVASSIPSPSISISISSPSQRKRIAYAISITKDGAFQDGAAVLAFSIFNNSRGSDYDVSLIAFVHPNVTTSRPVLQRLGYHVIETPIPIK